MSVSDAAVPDGASQLASRCDPGAVVILGGRSEIGLEVAQRFAPGRTVVLAARRSNELDAEVAKVKAAGATRVVTAEFDADDISSHDAFFADLTTNVGQIGAAVLCFGILGDQDRAESDPHHAVQVIHTDYVAQVSVLTHLAQIMRAQKSGHIVVFSSVAGVRVRRANYVYGSAKAGLDGFANGLADALHGTGVHLLIVRPGFVIGRMTEGMSPAPFSSTPPQVADAVVRAAAKKRRVVWVPLQLKLLFMALQLVPQWAWRRMPR
ncbi:SDR family NAD(P)-dependent oxidoreductase [Hoyosella rhizosphaerae]|nr:SDR family NAD(P)-dependent oxidoreductase [Hoyosella rhizosphaerae]